MNHSVSTAKNMLLSLHPINYKSSHPHGRRCRGNKVPAREPFNFNYKKHAPFFTPNKLQDSNETTDSIN
jgi:hypothetical protein